MHAAGLRAAGVPRPNPPPVCYLLAPPARSAGAPAAGGGELDGEYEEVAQPGRPLHWFGSLVAPSLRDAEGHFQRALQLAVEAANAQGRLRRGLEQYQASGGAAAAAAAQPS